MLLFIGRYKMKRVDITGLQFGRLEVLKEAGRDKWGKITYECLCDCGNVKTILGSQIKSGRAKSCGCLQKDKASQANTKHGMHDSTEYRAWRTVSDKNENIQVEWKEFKSFYEDMGERPSNKHMICKHDINKGYNKNNCYWGTGVKRLDVTKFTGKVYGRLTIIGPAPVNKFGQPRFECLCSCGKSITNTTSDIQSGEVRSCGCLQKDVTRERMSRTKQEFIEKASKYHNNKYDYTFIKYVDHATPVKIGCPKHGEFEQKPSSHLQHGGCPKCGIEATAAKNVKTQKEFLESAAKIHGTKFGYQFVKYVNAKTKVQIICSKHGAFLQMPNGHLNGNGCPKCGTAVSKAENEIADFIEGLNIKIARSVRTLFKDSKKEADIFIPSKKLIIEYDGNYYHSEARAADKFNVLHKTELAQANGYRCIHIREDQWEDQKEVVQELLKAQLGIYVNRIGARKTMKRNLTNVEYRESCQYHLQGFRPAVYKKGLFYNDELVASIGYNRDGELVRYVVKKGWQILGALPKLLKDEKVTYSFCDLTFFSGTSYAKAGFKLDYITKPNYRYVKNKKTVTRNTMMKHKLESKFANFDENLTEVQNCANNGWYRLFDCGNAKYII